jgi:hypothetical protein
VLEELSYYLTQAKKDSMAKIVAREERIKIMRTGDLSPVPEEPKLGRRDTKGGRELHTTIDVSVNNSLDDLVVEP